MVRRTHLLVVISLAIASSESDSFGDITVNSWFLESGVFTSSSQAFGWSDTVQNPYEETLIGTLGGSFARTTHSFAWNGDLAHFDIVADHHAEQFQGHTLTDGRIHLTPSVDSIITGVATWEYAWPSSALGDVGIGFNVYDLLTFDEIVAVGDHGGNFDLGPSQGSLNAQGSALLLAGRQYELFYGTRTTYYSTTPTGSGSGEIHLSITPVPEPAALALILPALLLPRRRAR